MRHKKSILLTALFTLVLAGASGQYPFEVEDKAHFFEQVDISYPGLEPVARAVAAGRYDEAAEAYLRFFDTRTDRRYMYSPHDRQAMVADLRRMYPAFEAGVIARADTAAAFAFPIEGEVYRYTDGDIRWRDDNMEWINVLNRMGYLNDLGLAWWYTGDDKYFDAWWHILSDWMADNPVPDYTPELTGGIWSPLRQSYTAPHGPWRALETGIRIGNWLQSYYYFADAPGFTTERKWMFFRSAMEHARYIRDYLRRGACGNWESTVSAGFIPLAVMTPEWKGSAELLDYACATLANNLSGAVNDEGFQFELTPGYHRHVGEGMAQAQYFLEMNGFDGLGDEAMARLKTTYDVIAALKKPDNSDPCMGDLGNDFDGLQPDKPKGDSTFFARAVILFRDPLHKSLCGGFPPQDYVRFGRRGYDRFRSVNPARELRLTSRCFPVSKLAVMRSGAACIDTTASSYWCLFDNSPDGVGSHSHHDYLNIELFAYDKTLLIDPGRGVNYNDPLFGSYYRAVRAHNVVQVGPDSTRQLRKRAGSDDVRNEGWISNALYDYAKGVLADYDGVMHERELLFVKNGEITRFESNKPVEEEGNCYWLLRDRLTGAGAPLLRQYFHLWPGETVSDSRTKIVVTNHDACANLCIVPVLTDGIDLSVDTGYVSSDGNNLPAPIVAYSQQQQLPARFETILFPVEKGSVAPDFDLRPIRVRNHKAAPGSHGFSIRTGDNRTDYFYLTDSSCLSRFDDHTMLDGQMAFCRIQDDRPTRLMLHGRSLEWEGFSFCYSEPAEVRIQINHPDIRPGVVLSESGMGTTYFYYSSQKSDRITLKYLPGYEDIGIICSVPSSHDMYRLRILSHDPKAHTVTVEGLPAGESVLFVGKMGKLSREAVERLKDADKQRSLSRPDDGDEN